MATAAGRRLTLAHKKAQGQIGTATVARMRTVWRLLDGNNLDKSFDRWLAAAVPIVQTQRLKSAEAAAAYLGAFRTLETGGDFAPLIQAALPVDEVTTSLLVTGPVSVKRAMLRGVPLVRAMSVAEAASAAAAMRHALNGGRDTIVQTLHADDEAKGWQRVASGNACKFCAVLDGKFHYADTADFEAHDGCSCSQEPVYGERRVSELSLANR